LGNVRQRPGTAKGFVFLTMEDETGVANIIITPQLFDKYRWLLLTNLSIDFRHAAEPGQRCFLLRQTIRALSFQVAAVASHDFH